MSLQTITQISKEFNLSTRTLRYYEQIGLIKSEKKEGYAYRVYIEDTVKQLQQIVVLRKLRISLKHVKVILNSENADEIIATFRDDLAKVNDEINSLSVIRDIIGNFISKLNKIVHDSGSDSAEIKVNIMDDTILLTAEDKLKAIKSLPKFSMGFDIGHNDTEMVEAFELYQEAFGANKIAEFSPGGPNNLHIVMDVYGIEILLHPVAYGEERTRDGGIWAYDDDDTLWNAINVLSRDAREVRIDSWHHWPIAAFIIDKYGIARTLHN